MVLALLLLASPVVAQEPPFIECDNIKESILCDAEDNQDVSWDFLDDFKTHCDSYYGCSLGHNIIKW